MKKLIIPLMVICLLTLCAGIVKNVSAETSEGSERTRVIVIDPGHGGKDPGKVGVNEVLEKDVNLQIALLLRDELESEGYIVMMTRETDIGLYSEGATNKKREDLKARVAYINLLLPDLAISIHQNSYSDSSCKGAQVFYYDESEGGHLAASYLQKSLKELVDPSNHRVEKSESSYYILKETMVPTVIVECGFLSSYDEADKLIQPEYQKKLATAMCSGVKDYFSETKE